MARMADPEHLAEYYTQPVQDVPSADGPAPGRPAVDTMVVVNGEVQGVPALTEISRELPPGMPESALPPPGSAEYLIMGFSG